MSLDLNFITNNAIVGVPLVLALVQAIKLTGFVQDHFAPLLAIAVGIGIAFLSSDLVDFSAIILSGVVMGLMSSGLYSGVKTTMVANMRMKEQQRKENTH